MRHRLFTIGVLLAVTVVLLGGVSGCARQAASREGEEIGPVSVDATQPLSAEATEALPGATVVSAVTPAPVTETQPAMGSGAETPTAVETAVVDVLSTPVPPTAEPAAAPTSAPAAGDKTVWHTVQQGETLAAIAQRYGTTVQAIANANSLSNPNVIYVGQKLKIPTSGSTPPGGSSGGTSACRYRHTVQRGEWVWQIARNYGVSPYDILAANGLTIQTANTIYPGKVLCIP